MAEFVQRHLEDLTSAFSVVKRNELMTKEEIKTMIDRIRQMDYSVNKRTKRPQDYIKYGEYLSGIIDLLAVRRKEMKIDTKFDKVEKVLKERAAMMFRSCRHRFKRVEFFRHEINFLKHAKLWGQLSKAYTRMLQLHGNDPRLHQEAALYEFEQNKSVENARTLFQYAVRKFGDDAGLWLSFFTVEVKHVLWLLDRRQVLMAKEGVIHDDNEIRVIMEQIEDAVFEFKVAELVLVEACEKLGDKAGDFLIDCYKFVKSQGAYADKVVEIVYQHVCERGDDEVKTIVDFIKEYDGQIDDMELYQKLYDLNPLERIRQKLLAVTTQKLEKEPGDETAVTMTKEKINGLLEAAHVNGTAQVEDYVRYFKLKGDHFVETEYVEKALELDNKNADFWNLLIGNKVEEFMEGDKTEDEAEMLMNLFEKALPVVKAADSLPLWKSLIDFSIAYFPEDEVETVFKRAITKTSGEVGSALKMIRLEYVKNCHGAGSEQFKEEYKTLARKPPNCLDFHLEYICSLQDAKVDKDIQQVFNTVVAEHGRDSIDVWLCYGKFALENMALEVSKIYQRATVNVNPELMEQFKIEWENMIKEDAASA